MGSHMQSGPQVLRQILVRGWAGRGPGAAADLGGEAVGGGCGAARDGSFGHEPLRESRLSGGGGAAPRTCVRGPVFESEAARRERDNSGEEFTIGVRGASPCTFVHGPVFEGEARIERESSGEELAVGVGGASPCTFVHGPVSEGEAARERESSGEESAVGVGGAAPCTSVHGPVFEGEARGENRLGGGRDSASPRAACAAMFSAVANTPLAGLLVILRTLLRKCASSMDELAQDAASSPDSLSESKYSQSSPKSLSTSKKSFS